MAEAIGFIARLDDVAMMRESVEERRGHLRIDEDAGPLGEDQVRGDDHTGVLVQLREQVKEQRAPGLGQRQVAQFVEDHEIQVHQLVREPSGPATGLFLF